MAVPEHIKAAMQAPAPDLGVPAQEPVDAPKEQSVEEVVAELVKKMPPQFHMQKPEIQRIDLAMVHCDGDRELATKALGLPSSKELWHAMNQSKYLSGRWLRQPVLPDPMKPTTTKAVHITPKAHIAQGVLPTGDELERKLEIDADKFRKSLAKIQLTDNESQLGSDMFQLQMRHGFHGMALLGGGMQRAAMQLITLIDKLRKDPYPDEFTPDGMLLKSGQRETDNMILKAQSEYGKRATEYAQIMLLTQKTQKLASDASGGNRGVPGRVKPGFGPKPTQVLAQAGSTVVVNQGHGQEEA